MAVERLDVDAERVLCIVAHPDDLEYGASVAVARWTAEGRRVVYGMVTAGEAGLDSMSPGEAGPVREAEERAAAAAVGVDVVEFLGHHDGTVENRLDLRRDLAALIRRHRPQLVVTIHFGPVWGPGPGGAANQADHRHVGVAVLDACRDAGNRWVFTEQLTQGLEPWSGAKHLAVHGSPTPTHAVVVDAGHLEAGVRSLAAHGVYLAALGAGFDPRAFLAGSCTAAGREIGAQLAVLFELYDL